MTIRAASALVLALSANACTAVVDSTGAPEAVAESPLPGPLQQVGPIGSPRRVSMYGAVSGLIGEVQLAINGETVGIAANGPFEIAGFASGVAYNAKIATQPSSPMQTCTIQQASGIFGDNGARIDIKCETRTFFIGGSAHGLAGTVVLQRNDGEEVVIGANGRYKFEKPVRSGEQFSVWITMEPAGQACSIDPSEGSVLDADANLAVTCEDR